jgi:peptidoglycan-associated lipoprotein
MSRVIPAIAAAAGLGLLAAGCHHAVPPASPARSAPPPAAPAAPRAPAPPPPRAAAPPAPLSEAERFRRKSLAELNGEHPLGDVFFDYDQNAIRDEARAVLERDAAWLAKWPGTRIDIEGHCDERGTAEYNLALGSRRAEAVRDYLVRLGVAADRLTVKSLGKESPFCRDDGESCWSRNRRDHFVVTSK